MSIGAAEEYLSGMSAQQYSTTFEVTDELLDALTEAYREAMESIRS